MVGAPGTVGEMGPPEVIVCVDCGFDAHLLSSRHDGEWEAGDIAQYRCSGCNDRWDIEITEEDLDAGDPSA